MVHSIEWSNQPKRKKHGRNKGVLEGGKEEKKKKREEEDKEGEDMKKGREGCGERGRRRMRGGD